MTYENALKKKGSLKDPYIKTDKDGSLPKQFCVRIVPSKPDDRSLFLIGYKSYAYSGRGIVPDEFAKTYSSNNDFEVIGIRLEGSATLLDPSL